MTSAESAADSALSASRRRHRRIAALIAAGGLAAGFSASFVFSTVFPQAPIALVSAVAALSAGLAGVFIHHRYTQTPLETLLAFVDELRRGRFETPPPQGLPCCFNELTSGFLLMIERLRAIIGGAAESRAELEASNRMLLKQVSERIETEEKLKDSEARFRSIGETAHDAIIVIDHEGLVDFWNKAAERIFGWSSDEIIGKNLHELLVPERFRAAYYKAFPVFQKTGNGPVLGRIIEVEGLRRDGTEVPLELAVSSLLIKNEWRAVGIARDATLARKARTAMETAARDALAAAEMKTNFLSMISHELRTPLTAVLGFAKIIGRRIDADVAPVVAADQAKARRALLQIRNNVKIVLSEGSRLTELINNVLDLARLESGKMPLKPEPLDLLETTRNALMVVQGMAHEKRLGLRVEDHPTLPAVLADRDRLMQVLVNLLSNAVKFTQIGGVRVDFHSEAGYVEVIVEDTGQGVPPLELPTIFDKFRQLGDTLTDRPKGSGLGLAICKELVEQMGGRIWAESSHGEGSVFHFTLKRAD